MMRPPWRLCVMNTLMQHLLQSCRVFSTWLSTSEASAFMDEEIVRGALLAKRLPLPTEQRVMQATMQTVASNLDVNDMEARMIQSLQELQQLQQLPPTKRARMKKKQWLHDSFDERQGPPSCRYCGNLIVSKNTSIRKEHLLNARRCRCEHQLIEALFAMYNFNMYDNPISR